MHEWYYIVVHLWLKQLNRIAMKKTLIALSLISIFFNGIGQHAFGQNNTVPSYEKFIKDHIPSKKIIDEYLNELSWAKFDPIVGYTLGNYMPHDGMDNTSTISTAQPNGARTSFAYTNRPCRINAYGNSFTLCHQVSDAETWEEYLAGHLGEPIRNFGMGGFGVYQAYRRMLREESTKDSAQYIIFYIWGDDHMRSLLRCRYMTFGKPANQQSEEEIRNFHGNFWANVELDFNTKKFVENESLITTPHDLYKMTDSTWMVKNLKADLALQMCLFRENRISDIDIPGLKKLSQTLDFTVDLDNPSTLRENVKKLLDKYSFAATEFILDKAKTFAQKKGKKLMVVLFDPYSVAFPVMRGETALESRYDKEIVGYLQTNGFNYFDMNLVQLEDYKHLGLSFQDYFNRYFIGHYNPTGNHFFAFSILPKIVEWLEPKPITYRNTEQKMTDFKEYLMVK